MTGERLETARIRQRIAGARAGLTYMAEAKGNKLTSFDLVREELESTVKLAEQHLERFQENRDSSADIQNCIDHLNQLRGIFVLIEMQAGMVLCQEAVALANEVPVGAFDDKNELLTTLNHAIFTLKRYIDYFDRYRLDRPELILPLLNDMRASRKAKPLPESYFFDFNISRAGEVDFGLEPREPLADNLFADRVRRLRHMYQIGLLGLLRDRHRFVSMKLMERALLSLAKIAHGTRMARLWGLAAAAVQAINGQDMVVTPGRKRLFMKLEQYLRELVRGGRVITGKSVPDLMQKELLYIVALGGSPLPLPTRVLEAFGIQELGLSEEDLRRQQRELTGPGSDVIKSLSAALNEEISQIKDKLDIVQRELEPEDRDYDDLTQSMTRLSDTLSMLSLQKLSNLVGSQAAEMEQWRSRPIRPEEDSLMRVANAVLSVELAVKRMQEAGISERADRVPEDDTSLGDNQYFREAHIVVVSETRASIALAKRAITAFVESNWDKLHLANVVPSLRAAAGSLHFINQVRTAQALGLMARCIQQRLLDSDTHPNEHTLETMADALTSLEYFIEGMANVEGHNEDLLLLAEDSLKSLGYVS